MMTDEYEEILCLSRPVSKKHPQMPMSDRAAQFSPFAALTGYGDAVTEEARITDQAKELDIYEKEKINCVLNEIASCIKQKPQATLTFFQPDASKSGGTHVSVVGAVKKMDVSARVIYMEDGQRILLDSIVEIQILTKACRSKEI